ncbi:MAG: bifunctional folylpolyglutamate synthase/dihydrofolate synthase [Candidatus Margulisbacteria bacterium]|nr:bifunctional folylpolyglutamate synthase/dihydrofolate synthase [Candidatus Margulisiibacteriota bacterium]MBU1616937.1 bifunctional folylpolyglutamate synthase/dihydrofolate synthase [Candidatus Margulisiibacteriota bacterium]
MDRALEKYLSSLEKFGINLGLERITGLLTNLGNPQQKLQAIHVAGTNGKGSTCAMIAAILKELGYKVGLYTSPHLLRYNERFQINGREISEPDLSAGIAAVKKAAAGLPQKPTVFEVLTAVAFWYFAKKKVDFAVVEVGMGGRLDATNVIRPLVSVITNVELEHTTVLGRTLAKIAVEKGGIIKPGVPVVTAESKAEALTVLTHQANIGGSSLVQVGIVGAGFITNLLGEHQKRNAACAVAAVLLAGISADKKKIVAGLKKVRWPARFQVIRKKPLTIVDGAHNPAGVKTLVDTLGREYPGKKFVVIFGAQQDKEVTSMLALLRPLAKEMIITRSSHQQSSAMISSEKALELGSVLRQTASCDRVICGSLFLAGDTIKILAQKGR